MLQIDDIIDRYANLPNIWGEGSIFAFSGIDGPTNAASGFVATYGASPYDLLIHTPRRRTLQVRLGERGNVRLAIGDAVVVDTSQGTMAMAYHDWHTLVGTAPEGAALGLVMEGDGPAPMLSGVAVSADDEHGDAIALAQDSGGFALSYGASAEEALARARRGLGENIVASLQARVAPYGKLPRLTDPQLDRLLHKCFSVMRVNSLSPEGVIKRPWSTPDRVPHRDMWLWDSVFHSLAMNHLDPALSWEYLAAVLDTQQPDGRIPHQTRVNGWVSHVTQPPILGWGVWENFQALQDKETLAYALLKLERYLEWDLANRDQNQNGLLEWLREGDRRSRSGESGLDNSPRFDNGKPADDVDFSAWAAADMRHVALIAQELGERGKAELWRERASRTEHAIQELLWSDADGFYLDRYLEGVFSRVKAVSGFMPLLLDGVPDERVQALVDAMHDPRLFGAPFPLPTVALSDPNWSTDMWRGATWANTNYFAIRGLGKQGQRETADWLAERTIHFVNKYYQQYGVLFEFFDAKDQVPPTQCDRKGKHQEPYDIRRKMDSIRDYHWTAAVTFDLLLRRRG